MSSKTTRFLQLPRPGGSVKGRRRLWKPAAAMLTALALSAAGGVLAQPASAEPGADATVTVDADQPFRPVTHVATGSLYGIADNGLPTDDLIAPIKPNTFVQKPPGGLQQRYGDVLNVWQAANRANAGIVVRLSDYYPGWPYQFSWDNTDDRKAWGDVIRDVVAQVKASGATNIVAYAPWNESDNTWLAENGTYEDMWVYSYNLLRELLGPDVPIQGPSFSDNISDMRNFLENAVATDTVPDVLEWHELIRSSKIKGDVESVRAMLDELGIGDLPIDIAEYAHPQEVGIPGPLVGYIAKFERFGVQRAELAFWNGAGTLGDLLTETGGVPNGAYWLYTWYAGMSGDMVTTTPPSNDSALDGAASVTAEKDKVDIIAGGNSGATSIVVNGLDELALGDSVNVQIQYTASYGRTTPTAGPNTISNTTYAVGDDGSITVPVVMNPAYGYHIVVTPAQTPDTLAGTYTISNINSGLLLDTQNSGTVAGTSAVQAPAAAGSAATQTWDVVPAGSGLYEIVNSASGLVLGVKDASTDNGAPALIADDNGADDHLWQLVPDGNGNVRFMNYGTGRALGVAEMSTDAGAAVVQWTDGAPTSNCRADGPRQPGKIGTALSFCGSNSYMTMPEGIVSGLDGDWSISTWVNPASIRTWSRIFDFGTGPGANMFLTISAGSGPRFAITSNGAGAEQQLNYSGQNLPLGAWSLVTVTASGSTGTLYVDGQAVATNDQMTTHPADLGVTDHNWISKSQYGGDPAFDGAVDDFSIYSHALTASEVAQLAAGQPSAGDVARYAFDEQGGGPTAVDSSGSNRDATITSGDSISTMTTATDEATADRFWTLNPAQAPSATATITTLKGSAASVASGSDYTLTATVQPKDVPGTIEFSDGSTTLGRTDTAGGGAIFQVEDISVGTHTFTARFIPSDEAAYQRSVSGEVTVAVAAATDTAGPGQGSGSGNASTASATDSLASTGSAVPLWLVGAGFLLVAGGIVLRRRRATRPERS